MKTPAACHPDRDNHGRGLCESCYRRAYDTDSLPPKRVYVPVCHPEKKNVGRGLCTRCYTAAFRAGKISTKKATCHPDRQHCSFGLCRPCYMKAWDSGELTKVVRNTKVGMKDCSDCGKLCAPGNIRNGVCRACENRRNRREVIAHYTNGTNVCACCNEHREAFFAVDHINGRTWEKGKRPRSEVGNHLVRRLIRLGFPPGYRVLCHNCNQATRFGRPCVHDNERAADAVIAEVSGFDKELALLDKFTTAVRGA